MLSLILFVLLVSIFTRVRLVYHTQASTTSDSAELAALREALARAEADREAARDSLEARRDNVAARLLKQNHDISLLIDRSVKTRAQELRREFREKEAIIISQQDRQMRLLQQSRDEEVAAQILKWAKERCIRAEKRGEELEAELRAMRQRTSDLEGKKSALVLQHSHLSRRLSDLENGRIGINSTFVLE